ncbi:MAG: inorganic diphosphatase [Bdellovibrionales bacterium]|nr:inorganic diphosphatase [Bdellovibrionales bacterium]
MNPWHDVELEGSYPDEFPAIIEVPKGSKNKYELHKPTGMIKVDRVLFSSVHYPANYGFIPKTYCDDNDPLDVLVLGQEPVYPLSIMTAIPIGLMKMVDQGEADDKIIAVHAHDPEYSHYTSIQQLPPHRMAEVQSFFEEYKNLENKVVEVKDFFDVAEAKAVLKQAKLDYEKKFK